MKKLKIFLIIFFLAVLILPNISFAQSNNLDIYFFWGNGCPHCAKEKDFLENTVKWQYPQANINSYEVYNNQQNLSFLKAIAKELNTDIRGVPVIIIGDQPIVGYLNDQTTGQQITDRIDFCLNNQCNDSVAGLVNQFFPTPTPPPTPKPTPTATPSTTLTPNHEQSPTPETTPSPEPTLQPTAQPKDSLEISLPIIGDVDTENFSLPVLTVIIAAIDGFNPCAMWVLLFLISLLLGMKNKKRMWILGTSFILASGFVYFLFLSAWLNFFLFIGFIIWVRIIIGLVAVGSGVFHLYDFYKNKPGCKVIKNERRQKIFNSLKFVTETHKFWLALLGIIVIAFAVNLIELVCSAGLPAIYTNVLALSDLPSWQYYALLLLYIIIFMIDDMLIFVIAMVTLQVTGISTKYTRWANLIGGIVILILGILLLFRPEWLMFG